jgi:3-isopropylmalate/(R)-2-methylmalate dehydratase large subunit
VRLDVGEPAMPLLAEFLDAVIAPELEIAPPDATLICGDSHACTNGGVGALAWGSGTSELAHVVATRLPGLREDH